jgi:hypothetical protein
MQDFGVVQIANANLKKKCDDVEQNQHENCRRASELAMPNTVSDWNGCESNGVVLARFQVPK